MRGPAPRTDSQSDTAIADTYRFLERYMQSDSWKADPDGFACDNRAAIDEVEASKLPDWAKNFGISALLEQTKKRRGKPTRRYRDVAIREAAMRLVSRGYKPTRNDVTRDRDSASSVICQALGHLGEKISEKSINAVVMKYGADYFSKHKVSPAFMEWLRKQAPNIVHWFESDPPVVLK
jgi:hypothetical protein